jgi:putative PIN family toxin of toxin-antitoxin system
MTLTGVYDTNVIVSAILKPGSIPASLVALAMEGAVRLFLTQEILEEYREVLKRPKFGFDSSTVDTFLNDLEKACQMVYPTKRVRRALDEPDSKPRRVRRPPYSRLLNTLCEEHSPPFTHCPACLWIIFAMVPLCQRPPFKVGMPASVHRLAILS